VFYLRYLRDELMRRGARTFLAALALAVGVALVIDVAALGAALHTGQARVLDPLGGLVIEAPSVAVPPTVTVSVAETVSVLAEPSPPPRIALPEQLVLARQRYGR